MYYLTFDSFSGMCHLSQSFFFAEKVSIFSHFKAQPKQIASNGCLQHSHECPAAKKRLIIAAMACNNLWLEPDRVLLFFNSSKTKCALPFRDSITVLGFASILPFFKHKAWKLHWLKKKRLKGCGDRCVWACKTRNAICIICLCIKSRVWKFVMRYMRGQLSSLISGWKVCAECRQQCSHCVMSHVNFK